MSDTKKRISHGPEYKAKIGLEAVRGVKTINEIAEGQEVHPVQARQYKKQILAQASQLFESKRGPEPVHEHSELERLYSDSDQDKSNIKNNSKTGVAQQYARQALYKVVFSFPGIALGLLMRIRWLSIAFQFYR